MSEEGEGPLVPSDALPKEPAPEEADEEIDQIAEAIATVVPEEDEDGAFFLEQYGRLGYSVEVAQVLASISFSKARRLARHFDHILAGEEIPTTSPAPVIAPPIRHETEGVDEELSTTPTSVPSSSTYPAPAAKPVMIQQLRDESSASSIEERIFADMAQSPWAVEAARELLRQLSTEDERQHEIVSILGSSPLSPREREVLLLRTQEGLTQSEAAMPLQVSRAYIGQVERRGLGKVYRHLLPHPQMLESLAEIIMVLEEVAANNRKHQGQARALVAALFVSDPEAADTLLASPHFTSQEQSILSMRWDNQSYLAIAQAYNIDITVLPSQEALAYSKLWMVAQFNPNLRNLLISLDEASDFPRRASSLKPTQEAQLPVKRLYDAGYHESVRLVLRQAGIQPVQIPMLLEHIGAGASARAIAESPRFGANSANVVANTKTKSLQRLYTALPTIAARNPAFAALAVELKFAHLPQVAAGLSETYPPA